MADIYLCFRLSDGSPVGLLPEAREEGGTVKTYKVKKLADGEHKGKFGVFDADDAEGAMMGLAEVEGFSEQSFSDSYGLKAIGPKARAYKEALKRYIEKAACCERDAEINFVRTDEGLRLYEAFRSERMSER